MVETRVRSSLYFILGSLCLGVIATIQVLVPENISPLLIGAMRITGGAVTLLLWGIFTHGLPTARYWPIIPTVCAALGLIAFQMTFFAGIDKAGISLGTSIPIGIVLLVSGLSAKLFYREKVSLQWIIYTILALIGLGCIIATSSRWHTNKEAIITASIAGIGYALFLVSSKVLVRFHRAESVMTVLFTISAIVLFPIFFIEPFSWPGKGSTVLLSLIQFAIITTVIAFSLIGMGLKNITLSVSSTLSVACTFMAVFLGIFFLEVHLSMQLIFGLILLLVCITMLVRRERRNPF
ncbi:DMT family transporter [Lawsonia intracellularis]|uniref:Membrane protein, putative n=1 Tax=Lawsonia intracellularis (strain PHE/MN1-00) TaxID=363253 RepID=Q1MNN0_LAWIP|nr:DMT family transporter [Lawsonia intracellularis]AGC50765.1 hypothetical protein LAW_30099 [Lawsonia intracellularis N343]KAA0204097.1 EamA/RhaT family transporter [Lawsonia intracellularis]MBZ3893339.1 DMT family transporter [Lawsonia intracellularis]OMQ01661.1 hypothetical protein BW722_07045 [Lawsonia intracellularis]RBN31939.1 DMT family transporter [Lawsonia intracellularis]